MYITKKEFLSGLEKELARFGVNDKSEIIADFEQHFTDSAAEGLSEADICKKLGDIAEIAKQYADEDIFPAVAVETPEKTQSEPEQLIPNTQNDILAQPEKPTQTQNQKYNSTQKEQQNSILPPLGSFERIKMEDELKKQGAHSSQQNSYSYNNASYGSNASYAGSTAYENSGIKINFNAGGLIAVICVDIFILSWAVPSLFAIVVALLSVPVSLAASGIAMIFGGAFNNFLNFYSPFSSISNVLLGVALTALGGLLLLAGIQLVKLFIKICKAIINWHGTMINGKPVFAEKEKKR